MELEVDFLETVHGSQFILPLEKTVVCDTCEGSRCEDGTAPSRCWTCGGKGYLNYRDGATLAKVRCHKCKGGGMTIKYPCKVCKGEGTVQSMIKDWIRIPKGTREGEEVIVKSGGNQSFNGLCGDLILEIKTNRATTDFERKGDDVSSAHNVKICDAVLGTRTKIQTLWGNYSLDLDSGVTQGDCIVLENFGVNKKVYHGGHKKERADAKGKHYLNLNIQVPEEITEEERELYERLAEIETQIGDRRQEVVGESQEGCLNVDERENFVYHVDLTQTKDYEKNIAELSELQNEEGFIDKLKSRWF